MKKGPLVGQGIGSILLRLCGDCFINHYKDPYSTTRIQWKVRGFVFVAHMRTGVIQNLGDNICCIYMMKN